MTLNRRNFLAGLFGTAAVAAAGAIPAALDALPDKEFIKVATAAAVRTGNATGVEIWGDDKGQYSFCELPGFRPLREESNKLGEAALRELYAAYGRA